MKLNPLSDNVLVKRKQEEKFSPGGLHLPGTALQASMEAEVLAVGPGRPLENGQVLPMTVKPGNTVLVPKTGMDIKFENEDYVMIQEYQILAVITE